MTTCRARKGFRLTVTLQDESRRAEPRQDAPAHIGTELPGFKTVPQAAWWAQCSPWTVKAEIRRGRLRAQRVGRLVRILDEDLLRWARGEAPRGSHKPEEPS